MDPVACVMTAPELFDVTCAALAVTGNPTWDSPDAGDERDALVYLTDDADDGGPLWALTPLGSEDADYVPIDTAMAQELIEAQLRSWLLDRGWQVQVTLRKQALRWRLVDCLSIVEGGGDRLDHDYPAGVDALAVLSESVVAVDAG